MTYAESIAVDLARVVGVQPGSLIYHGIVGALTEVVERCAKEADCKVKGCDGNCQRAEAARDIRALASTPGKEE